VVFTSWFDEKTENKGMANFILKLYDKELKEIKTVTLELTKFSELASYAFTGKHFLFIFVDAMKKNRTMVTMDAAGNVIQRKSEEDVRRALLIPENFPVIHVLNDSEFLLIRPMREKKFGYDIERLDKDLVSKWVKSHIPDDGILKAQDSKVENGRLYLLREKNPNRTSDNFTYSVQCFDLSSGEQIYSTDLLSEEAGGAPSFIRVSPSGEVATGGMYFKGAKYDDKNSDGLFFALLSPTGAVTQFSKNTWSSLKDQISGEFSSALIGGKTKIMVEDVITKKDGTYMVIAEQFKKANNASMTSVGAATGLGGSSSSGAAGSEVGFTVLDFVFFNFDKSGKLTSIDVVGKESKEARVSGSVATEKGLAVAQYMKAEGFFGYKGVIENNGQQMIFYRNDEGFKSKAFFLPIGEKYVAANSSIDMDKWIPENLNKLGEISKATSGNQYTFNSDSSSDTYELYKNIRPFSSGKMLLYHFNQKGLKIWIEPVPSS